MTSSLESDELDDEGNLASSEESDSANGMKIFAIVLILILRFEIYFKANEASHDASSATSKNQARSQKEGEEKGDCRQISTECEDSARNNREEMLSETMSQSVDLCRSYASLCQV
jgi:hypothetical protein